MNFTSNIGIRGAFAASAAIIISIFLALNADAQGWGQGQGQGQAGGGGGQQAHSTTGMLLQRLRNNIQSDQQAKAKQAADKKAAEDAYRAQLAAGLCPPPMKTTQGPEQRGKSNDWHNFTNMMHRLPNGASANMGGENNAFKNHMGAERAGTFETGGSRVTSVDDSLGHSRYSQNNGNATTTYMTGQQFANSIGGRMGN